MDDVPLDSAGLPVHGVWDAARGCMRVCDAAVEGAVPLRRPEAHFWLALSVIERFGHNAAAGKGVPPCLQMDLLGVRVDVAADQRRLTSDKCKRYSASVREVLGAPRTSSGALRAPRSAFNSLVHRLLHSSAVVVLGRQHVHHTCGSNIEVKAPVLDICDLTKRVPCALNYECAGPTHRLPD